MNLVIDVLALITYWAGVHEEIYYLGIPCVTLRNNTERSIVLSKGSNLLLLVGKLLSEVGALTDGDHVRGCTTETDLLGGRQRSGELVDYVVDSVSEN